MRPLEFDYILYKGLYVPMIPAKLKCGEEWFDYLSKLEYIGS